MGGRGSTRWRHHKRRHQVEHALAIDLLDGGWRAALALPRAEGDVQWCSPASGPPLRLQWHLSPLQDDGTRLLVLEFGDLWGPRQRITLEPVQVGFSHRLYARCPRDCGRRARKLYWVPRLPEFACWRCAGLQYAAAQEHDARVDAFRQDAPAAWRARAHLRGRRSRWVTARLHLEAEQRGLELPRRLLRDAMPPEILAAIERDGGFMPWRLPKRRDRRPARSAS